MSQRDKITASIVGALGALALAASLYLYVWGPDGPLVPF
jgi:hypothetical protein